MVYLRDAVQSDMDLLYAWANDPTVRKNSFNSGTIIYEEHVGWFKRTMEDEHVLLFILMDSDIPVGQIRLNVEDDVAEIGYSIAAEFRGKGYGHKLLQLTVKKVQEDYPQIERLIAKVKTENTISCNLFEREGYEKTYSCYSLSTL